MDRARVRNGGMPDEYGKWNSVSRCYRRWVSTGVFDAKLETPVELAELAGRGTAADMIESAMVRAHHCAVDIKGGLANRGALPITGRLHHQTPRQMRRQRPPTRFSADARPRARCSRLLPLFRMIGDRIEALFGNRGYDADAIRE